MTLLMVLLARAYAPLTARGALIDGMSMRESVAGADRRSQSAARACTPVPGNGRRTRTGPVCTTQCDCESLAA